MRRRGPLSSQWFENLSGQKLRNLEDVIRIYLKKWEDYESLGESPLALSHFSGLTHDYIIRKMWWWPGGWEQGENS